VTDPELSQADSAVLWELPLLAVNYWSIVIYCNWVNFIRSIMIHWLGSMLVISVLVLLCKERAHYIQVMQDGREDDML